MALKSLKSLPTIHKPKSKLCMTQMSPSYMVPDPFHRLPYLCTFTNFPLFLKFFSAYLPYLTSRFTYILSRWAQGKKCISIVVKNMGISVLKPCCESCTLSSLISALPQLSLSESQCPLWKKTHLTGHCEEQMRSHVQSARFCACNIIAVQA